MLQLILGNKNYSSWSMRPYLALAHTGAPFEEQVIPLFEEGYKARIHEQVPSGLVPALRDGDQLVWDSLSICEYLAERFPQAHLWPADAGARAHARSVSCEMHAGFLALRREMPMNLHRSRPGQGRTDAALADIERVTDIWRDCLQRYGGPFLFGSFTIADCMYAPVVTRFLTYGVEIDDACRGYMDAIMAFPPMVAWHQAARAEPWTIAQYEE